MGSLVPATEITRRTICDIVDVFVENGMMLVGCLFTDSMSTFSMFFLSVHNICSYQFFSQVRNTPLDFLYSSIGRVDSGLFACANSCLFDFRKGYLVPGRGVGGAAGVAHRGSEHGGGQRRWCWRALYRIQNLSSSRRSIISYDKQYERPYDNTSLLTAKMHNIVHPNQTNLPHGGLHFLFSWTIVQRSIKCVSLLIVWKMRSQKMFFYYCENILLLFYPCADFWEKENDTNQKLKVILAVVTVVSYCSLLALVRWPSLHTSLVIEI